MESSWQDQCYTLKERFRKILEKDFMSDMNFVIGKEHKIKIPAHRLVVSCASHKLAEIVRNLTPEANDVPVTDTTPSIFHIFLEYIYTGDIVLHKDDEVKMIYVWQLAKYFEVKDLELECKDFLRDILTPDQPDTAMRDRVIIHLCHRAQLLEVDGETNVPLKNALNRVLRLTSNLETDLVVKYFQNLQIKDQNTNHQPEKIPQKLSLQEILASNRLSELFVGQKFSTIIVHEELARSSELQFQPNQQILMVGFGVFAKKNLKITGVLSIERLDAENWKWIGYRFFSDYTIFERFDYNTQIEVVFIKTFPQMRADKGGTYRLIFRETNVLYRVTGRENITCEFVGNKENFMIDFRTKFESYTTNSIPFLLFELNHKDVATQTSQRTPQRGILREITYNY